MIPVPDCHLRPRLRKPRRPSPTTLSRRSTARFPSLPDHTLLLSSCQEPGEISHIDISLRWGWCWWQSLWCSLLWVAKPLKIPKVLYSLQSVQDESRCTFQKYSLNTPRSYLSKSYSMSRVSRLADQLSFRSPTSSYLRFWRWISKLQNFAELSGDCNLKIEVTISVIISKTFSCGAV